MNINNAFSSLGSFGKYQLYVYLISCLPVINAGIVMLSLVFLTASPNHRCFVPNCDSIETKAQYLESYISYSIPKLFGSLLYDSCQRFAQINHDFNNKTDGNKCDVNWFTNNTESCDSYVFDNKEFDSTVVTEFNIVCNNSWKLPLTQSIFYFGVLSGAFCFGAFADRYGRKTVFMLAPIVAFFSALLSAFSPTLLLFIISSAITTACVAGMYQTAFIIGFEFIGGKWRVWCSNLHSAIFAVGGIILCLMAYYIRDWRQLQFVIALPLAVTLSYPWLFPESVRWQASNGQSYKAIKTIEKAAKWNKVNIPNEYLYICDDSFFHPNPHDIKHYGPIDLLRHPITRRWAYNLFFIWFTTSLVYYSLSLQASSIGTNIYVTFGWLAFAEIPAIIMATIAMEIFGRKIVLFFLLLIGGISCISSIFLPQSYRWLITVLAVFGRSNISAAFSLIYVYSVEIFPTVLRSSGLGMCSMCSRIGGILAPQLIELKIFGDFFPILISGVVSVMAGLLVVNLPETHNRPLPETLEDIEVLRDSNRSVDIKTQLSHGLIHLSHERNIDDKEERVQLLAETQS